MFGVGFLERLRNGAKVGGGRGGLAVVLSQKMLKLPQVEVSTYLVFAVYKNVCHAERSAAESKYLYRFVARFTNRDASAPLRCA
jgi:hypothetical protein